MRFLLFFLGCFVLNTHLFSQTTAVFADKDSADIFQQGAAPGMLEQYNALWKNPVHKAFWEEFRQKFADDFDPKKQYELLFTQNVDMREIGLFKGLNKQMAFLKNHPEFANLSAPFKRYVENTVRWNYWYWVLNHAVARSNADIKNLKMSSLPAVMIETLDPKKIADDEAFLTSSYRDLLMVFVTYFNSRDHVFNKYSDMGAAMNDKAAFAKKYLSGSHALPYYLCRLLRETCANTPKDAVVSTLDWLKMTPQSEKYVRLATEKCNDVLTKKEVKKPAEAASKTENEDDLIMQNADGKTFRLSNFKGKVVYLDFWASWCGPCRAEFPHSKAMQEKLTDKQKKKIVFLYASIDEKEEAWKKAMEQLQLPGENGHVKPADNAAILRKLRVTSIPRYVIIDKKGEIIAPDAPRPSSPDVLNVLLKLIDN